MGNACIYIYIYMCVCVCVCVNIYIYTQKFTKYDTHIKIRTQQTIDTCLGCVCITLVSQRFLLYGCKISLKLYNSRNVIKVIKS